MKFGYIVKFNGIYYAAGEDVPIGVEKDIQNDAQDDIQNDAQDDIGMFEPEINTDLSDATPKQRRGRTKTA